MSWIHDTKLEEQARQSRSPTIVTQSALPPASTPVLHELRPWLVPAGRFGLPVMVFVLLQYVFWGNPMIGACATLLISMAYESSGEARLRRFIFRETSSEMSQPVSGTLNYRQLISLAFAQPEFAWATYRQSRGGILIEFKTGLPITAYALAAGTLVLTSWSESPRNIPLSLAFLIAYAIAAALLLVAMRRTARRCKNEVQAHRGLLVLEDFNGEVPLSEFKTATLKWDSAAGQEYLVLHRDGVDYPIQSQTRDPLELLRTVRRSMPDLQIRSTLDCR